MKPYSKLNVRDRLTVDIERTEEQIRWYTDLGPEWADKVEELKRQKEYYEQKAGHYDREIEAGYKKPASQRNGISTGLSDGMNAESIDPD